MRANLFKMSKIALAASLGVAFNCSTTVEAPPQPSASDSSSSSLAADVKVLCLFGGQCLFIPATDCSTIGGQEVQKCTLASSSSLATTTSSGSTELPSSNSIEQTTSSSSAMLPVSSSSLASNVILCLFSGSCISIALETCSSIGGLQVQSCIVSTVSSSSNQPSSSSVQLYSSSIQQQQSSSSVAASSSSTTTPVSATRCKDNGNRDFYCSWPSGCYAIDPTFAETPGQTCAALIEECNKHNNILYVGPTAEGEGIECGPPLAPTPPGIESGTFRDIRDDKVYKWVKIGTQTWMAMNLKYKTSDSKCIGVNNDGSYGFIEANNVVFCNTYGRLYSWKTAMALSSSSSSQIDEKHKGICPSGWHIPSNLEWGTLIAYVESDKGCINCAGKHLKATISWYQNGNGLDSYGFSALESGEATRHEYEGKYYYELNFGNGGGWWWSSDGLLCSMGYNSDSINCGTGRDSGGNLYSVRCIKD